MASVAASARVDLRSRPRRWEQSEDLHISTEVLRLTRTKGTLTAEDWNAIAAGMHDRKGKQCRERWENKLMPSLSPEPFTQEEHDIIVVEVERVGHEWRTIAAKLPGRSPAAVKNYWYSFKRRMERREAGKLARNRKIKRLDVGVLLVPALAGDPAYASSAHDNEGDTDHEDAHEHASADSGPDHVSDDSASASTVTLDASAPGEVPPHGAPAATGKRPRAERGVGHVAKTSSATTPTKSSGVAAAPSRSAFVPNVGPMPVSFDARTMGWLANPRPVASMGFEAGSAAWVPQVMPVHPTIVPEMGQGGWVWAPTAMAPVPYPWMANPYSPMGHYFATMPMAPGYAPLPGAAPYYAPAAPPGVAAAAPPTVSGIVTHPAAVPATTAVHTLPSADGPAESRPDGAAPESAVNATTEPSPDVGGAAAPVGVGAVIA